MTIVPMDIPNIFREAGIPIPQGCDRIEIVIAKDEAVHFSFKVGTTTQFRNFENDDLLNVCHVLMELYQFRLRGQG
jgi:hypothetical protein